MLTRSLSAGFAGLVLILGIPLGAQDRAVPPTDVAVTGEGTTATIKWSAVPIDGVVYRVLRSTDGRRTGVDITEPTTEVAVVDSRVEAGITYFYQVIAVFRDATTAAAAAVAYTAPSATVAPPAAPPPAPLTAITEVAPVRTAMPTEVSGVTVVGNTTASALVSWQPVPTATSYSIKRSYSSHGTDYMNTTQIAVTGLTTTSWNDLGPNGAGFPIASLYIYEVTAIHPFGTVSGQGAWKRPNPTCDEAPASQQMLTILDPTRLGSISSPLLPAGATIYWQNGWTRNGAIALRIDRSEQGSGTWTPVGSSCDGKVAVAAKGGVQFIDQQKGVAASKTYLYRLTGFAANGEVGSGTLLWTSPNRGVINWLSATSAGSTVTLKLRYEPPATNEPTTPERFRVTAAYGLNQLIGFDGGACRHVVGCSLVITGVPSGTHIFTAMAEWKPMAGVINSLHSPTTVVVQ